MLVISRTTSKIQKDDVESPLRAGADSTRSVRAQPMAGTVLPYRTSRPGGETLGIASSSLFRLAGG
jgi:hypothetical protein